MDSKKKQRARLIFIFFIATLCLGSIAIVDQFFYHIAGSTTEHIGDQRFIPIRERGPGLEIIQQPIPSGDQQVADSLEGKNLYTLEIDSKGFIKPSELYKTPDFKIAFLGGSTTELQFVDPLNRFAYKSTEILSQKLKLKINSLNGAMSGNSSVHSLTIFLNKLLPEQPNLVVFIHSFNDLVQLMYTRGTYWGPGPRGVIYRRSEICRRLDFICSANNFSSIVKNLLLGSSHVAGLLAPHIANRVQSSLYSRFFTERSDEWNEVTAEQLVLDSQKLLKTYRTNLEIFVAMAKAAHIIPILATEASRLKKIPDPFILNYFETTFAKRDLGVTYNKFRKLFNAFNEEIRKVAKEQNVQLIDLAKEVPQENKFMADIVHYNDTGSIYVANIIATALEPTLKKLK